MKKIKTEWDFKLFYKNDNDPQIYKDYEIFKKEAEKFESKYRNDNSYLENSKCLLEALNHYEKLTSMIESQKPLHFFHLRSSVESGNKSIMAKLNDLTSKYKSAYNLVIFFKIKLGKIDLKKQQEFLNDKTLSKFKYFLENIFLNSKYSLSESEEKILSLMKTPSREMWQNGFSKVLSSQEIKYKGKKIPIAMAQGMLSELKLEERRKLADLIVQKLIEISDFAESEINALVVEKKITDELKGFEKPYSNTVIQYENEIETVENLIESVTRNFKISHKYYNIKAKFLKIKKLKYPDRLEHIGKIKKKFDLESSLDILRSSFIKFDSKYEDMFNEYLEKGKIDFYPKKGKRGGAFCSGAYGMPTFVMLNHTNDFNSLTTLGHEMGHAFHTEHSNTQTGIYSDYTISVAEVASTFFENLVFDDVFEKLSDKEKIIALDYKINGSISTIFRQIACFNFENELHLKIREKGYLSKEEIANLMSENLKKYLGPSFDMKMEDGYTFVSWPHIRRHFYVYSYAFGELISDALYQEYKNDPTYKEKIEKFLMAGGSMCPEDIFKNAGIDIRDKNFFEKALKRINDNVNLFEKLIKKNYK